MRPTKPVPKERHADKQAMRKGGGGGAKVPKRKNAKVLKISMRESFGYKVAMRGKPGGKHPQRWERARIKRRGILPTPVDKLTVKPSSDSGDAPPHKIWFTYGSNMSTLPKELFDNVQHTIATYRRAWNEPNAVARLIVDEECRQLIQQTEPRLVPFFDAEQEGMFKADMCRIAVLLLHGGYYFDVDLRVITPHVLRPPLVFATATDSNQPTSAFFQAYLASTAGHPVLVCAMAEMLARYEANQPM
jgi:mannosyltransferase OCH1-like enzyme